VAAIVQRQNA